MVIVILFSVLIVAVYADVYDDHKKDFKLTSMRDAMYVQSSAANAVYAALWNDKLVLNLMKS